MNNAFIQKILINNLLSLEEKMTVIFIASNKNKNNETVISYSELANMLGKSKVTTIKYIKSLEVKGFIKLKNNTSIDGGRIANTYELNINL